VTDAATALKAFREAQERRAPGVIDSESDRAARASRSRRRASRIFGTRIPISNYYGPAAGLYDFGQGRADFFAAADRAAARRGANGMAPATAASRRGAAVAIVAATADGGASGLLSAELIFTRSLVAR
jgi:hypothetical protein